MIMKSQTYMAVLDWLSLQNIQIEKINSDRWIVNLREAVVLLKQERKKVHDHINKGFMKSGVLKTNEIFQAIDTMEKHLDLIANGKYNPIDGEEPVFIAEEIRSNIESKNQYAGNPFEDNFKTPKKIEGLFNSELFKRIKKVWGEVKTKLQASTNDLINRWQKKISKWSTSLNPSELAPIVNETEELIKILTEEVELKSSRQEKRPIRDLISPIRQLLEELEDFEPSDADGEDDYAQYLAIELKQMNPASSDGAIFHGC